MENDPLNVDTCRICDIKFVRKIDMVKHMLQNHETEMNFKCNICKVTFGNKVGLKVHLDIHRSEHEKKCEQCGYKLKNETELKKHIFLKHNIMENETDVEEDLDIHRSEFGKTIKKCEQCGYKLKNETELKKHIFLKHDIKENETEVEEDSETGSSPIKPTKFNSQFAREISSGKNKVEKTDSESETEYEEWSEEEDDEKMEIKRTKGFRFEPWHNDKDPEPIGYSIKSNKEVFKEAVKDIKATLKEGWHKEINNVDVKVEEVIEKKGSVEYEITVVKTSKVNKETVKGEVVMKIYKSKGGPKSITIEKVKGHDVKAVKVAAEDVIKVLIEGSIAGKEIKSMTAEVKTVECTECDRKFRTETNMKIHRGVAHRKGKNKKGKVADISKILKTNVKRKMEMKETERKDCNECDTKTKDQGELKRHQRDVHNIRTVSTSPAQKRPKKLIENKKDQEEIKEDKEEYSTVTTEKIDTIEDEINLRERLSKMRDDKIRKKKENERELEKKNEGERKEREESTKKRKKKQSKIIKDNEHDKMEIGNEEYSKAVELEEFAEKKEEDDLKFSEIKVTGPPKATFKKVEKKNISTDIREWLTIGGVKKKETNKEEIMKDRLRSQIKEPQGKIKQLLDEDECLLDPLADGICSMRCAAAQKYGDEVYGLVLRKHVNDEIANNMEKYKDIGFNASPDSPFEREVFTNGKLSKIHIESNQELERFLRSDKALTMWADNEDLAVLANWTGSKIEVIKDMGSRKPVVTTITPEKEEVMKKETIKMVLSGGHYQLVIKRNSLLAMAGSKSRNLKLSTEVEDEILKCELKKIREEKDKAIKNQKDIENELLNREEEYNRVKLENRKLKDIMDLQRFEGENKKEDERKGIEEGEEDIKWDCIECAHQEPQSEKDYMIHMKTVHGRKFTCKNCDFSNEEKSKVEEHMEKEHTEMEIDEITDKHEDEEQSESDADEMEWEGVNGKNKESKKECFTCGKEFDSHVELMKHRARHHPSKKICKFYRKKECKFSAKECAYSHKTEEVSVDKLTETVTESSDEFKCNMCDEKHEFKNDLMDHIKTKHRLRARECRNFRDGKCNMSQDECWYIHEVGHDEKKFSEKCKFGSTCRNLASNNCKFKHNKGFQKNQTSRKII